MNGQDKRDLNVILERLDQADEDRKNMSEDIKFIKENLFNPHEGLWAETKENTRFREESKKWRTITGGALVGLFSKLIYDFFS